MSKEILTPKQERFCQEYIIDLNGKQAAIRAGYSPQTAEVQGSVLLRNLKVKNRVQVLQSKVANKLEVTALSVMKDIEEIKIRCMGTDPTISDSGEEIEGQPFNAQGALKACELQAKHLGMFTEKHQVSGPNGGPIPAQFIVQFVDPEKDV
jgi:phage terminase small subunit